MDSSVMMSEHWISVWGKIKLYPYFIPYTKTNVKWSQRLNGKERSRRGEDGGREEWRNKEVEEQREGGKKLIHRGTKRNWVTF